MSINTNINRIGNITSSPIVALTGNNKKGEPFSAVGEKYIRQRNWERKLGRSINNEIDAKPLTWGKLLERFIFEKIGTDYQMCSDVTIMHPTIDYWAGSPDSIKHVENKSVIDFKCPKTLESFCTMSDCSTIEELRENHTDGEKYYWQLVSNGIITGCDYAELICYCPYQEELNAIRDLAMNIDDANPDRFKWIYYSNDEDLPYLIQGMEYKDIHIISWKIDEDDKKFLTDRVRLAGTKLNPRK